MSAAARHLLLPQMHCRRGGLAYSFLAWALLSVCDGRDYYEILGVPRTASDTEIKKAFRKVSLQMHPDKNPGNPNAADEFAEVTAAHEVLSDLDKRRAYDQNGEEGLKRHEAQANRGGGGGGGGGIFENFFGGQREEPRTPNVVIPIRLSLRQLYLGDSFDMNYVRQVVCSNFRVCQRDCPECHGPGFGMRQQQLAPGFVQNIRISDDRCVDRGKCGVSRCRACPDGLTHRESVRLSVDIERGMAEGQELPFEEVADEAVGLKTGNLVLKIRTLQHDMFVREGDNLLMTMRIPLVDALVGFETTLEHLDGRQVDVRKSTVTACGDIMHLKGTGGARTSTRRSWPSVGYKTCTHECTHTHTTTHARAHTPTHTGA